GNMLALLGPHRLEALPDLRVERRVRRPPIVPAVREPEVEDRADLILVHASVPGHAAVPPTVMPSISRVGRPTPAGTDWPPLPQTPMPSSSAMSSPIAATLVSTVGPSPIRVAPLIGAPRRPFSIR